MYFNNAEFNWYFITCFITVGNKIRGVVYNSELLEESFSDQLDKNISSCAKFMDLGTTNTAIAAKKNSTTLNKSTVRCKL